jgi:lipase maturation factor 1
MIFDGDCRFCRRWIARWRRRTKDRVRYLPFQMLGNTSLQVSREVCQDAVQFVDPNGRVFSGADAVVRLFNFGLPGGRLASLICSNPSIIWILRIGYRLVARNREHLSRIVVHRIRKLQR